MDRVQTDRLVAARPLPRDADELHAVCADARVADWLWPAGGTFEPGPRTLAQVRSLLVRDADHWKRHGFGPWVVRDRATGKVVGRAGLARTRVDDRDEVEVAWLIAADRWGEGLATEIARAAIRVAFEEVGLGDVIAFTLPHNATSRAVMDHCGFAYEADVEHAGLTHVLYRLAAA